MLAHFITKLVNATLVAAALERRGQECVDAVHCDLKSYDSCAEAEDIRIVVGPGETGRGDIVTGSGPDMPVTVGGNANADPGAADQHPTITAAGTEHVNKLIRHIRIVHGTSIGRAKVQDLDTILLQRSLDVGLEIEARMVGGHDEG